MNRLFRWYNQNRHMFWIVVVIIVMAFALIRTLNNYAKQVNRGSSSIYTTTYSAVSSNPNYSVISEKSVNEKEANSITTIINDFINYCNLKETEKAYNLLSDDCKNELYKTKEDFEQKYLDIYFKTKKTYTYKAWIVSENVNTYRIEFTEDLLSTGGTNEKKYEDYYTVVNVNGEYKLNINKYIANVNINRSISQDNLRITVISKDIYLENVIYNFKIENFRENDISLGNLNNPNTIILKDSNDLQYTAATWELIEQNLIVQERNIKNISIKFLREFKPQTRENAIEFNSINLNYGNEGNIVKIRIDI